MSVQSTVFVCPQCGSTNIYKDGFRDDTQETVQRYRCKEYSHRFDQHSLNTKTANRTTNHLSAKAKKMGFPQKIKVCAEVEHTPTKNEVVATPQIEKLLIQLYNDGKSASTIKNYKVYLYKLLKLGADLFDPENTKSVLAGMQSKKASKVLCASLLTVWFDFNGIYWKKPTYYRDSEVPFIPTEFEIDQLIAGLGKRTATFCQLLKDTGARPGEIAQLTWTDIDFTQRTINIKAEKRSNGRVLPLTEKTMNMLTNLSRKNKRLFGGTSCLRATYSIQRLRIAEKIANPNIAKISFKTFRHWKGTTDLHLYHDRERVQIILGHKSPNSTETYVHIDKMLYLSTNADAFTVKVADTLEEAVKLMEVGFEYHTEIAGHKVFRKRK